MAGAGALSSALQRRLLLYLVRRVLGHLVQDGDIKLEQIEAGIGSGHVEIRNVHLDTAGISRLLSHLPVRVTHGVVGTIIIDVPWSNLWTGELSVKIVQAAVSVTLTAPVGGARDLAASLHESIYSAAEEALENDEEGKQIERTIAEEAPSAADTGRSSQSSVAAYVTSIVNGLVARLAVSLQDIHIRVHSESSSPSVQVRVDDISVQSSQLNTSATNVDLLNRTLTLTGLSIWLDCDRTESTDSDSEDGSEPLMGASVADLRESAAASFFSSAPSMGASMYASAMSGSASDHGSRQEDITGLRESILIAKMDEPAIMKLQAVHQTVEEDHPALLSLSVEAGHVLVLLDPNTLSDVMRFADGVRASLQSASPSMASHSTTGSDAPTHVEAHASIKGFQLVCAYECASQLGTSNRQQYLESIEQFWARPAKTRLHVGHLRLRSSALKVLSAVKGLTSSTTATVGDVSIFEYLSPSINKPGDVLEMFPILIFDPNLEQESIGASNVEEGQALDKAKLAVVDWRLANASTSDRVKMGPYRRLDTSEAGWKVRSAHRRVSSSLSGNKSISNTAAVTIDVSSQGSQRAIALRSIPIHLFADLSTVNRVMPMLKRVGQRSRTLRAYSHSPDMGYSFETINGGGASTTDETNGTESLRSITIACPLVRAELRVPSNRTSALPEQSRLSGLAMRSGIVLAEACGITARSGLVGQSDAHADSDIAFKSINVCFCPTGESGACFVASIGSLRAEDEEVSCLPCVQLFSSSSIPAHGSGSSRDAGCDGRLPMLRVTLTKSLLDGLELVVDDLTMWSSSIYEDIDDGETESASDALKILGSRFFGSRYSTLSGSSASTEIVRRPERTPTFAISIDEARLSLIVTSGGSDERASHAEKRVQLAMSDLRVDVNSQRESHFTRALLTIACISLFDKKADESRHDIITRTLTPSLTQGSQPVVRVQFTSTRDPYSSFRGSQVDVELRNLTVAYDGDTSLVRDLIIFGRSPEGAFENVEPNERTDISFRIRDISLLLAPKATAARATALVGDLTIRAAFVSHHPKTLFKLHLADSHVFVAEAVETPDEAKKGRARTAESFWRSQGMWELVDAREMHAHIIISQLTRPEVEVKVNKVSIDVLACADSLTCLQTVTSALSSVSEKVSQTRAAEDKPAGQTSPFLDSLDEDAFGASKSFSSDADLLDDDLPKNPSFWGGKDPQAERHSVTEAAALEDALFPVDESESASVHSALTQPPPDGTLLKSDVVTVRLADPGRPLKPTVGYFTNPGLIVNDSDARASYASSVRVTARGCDVSLKLFAGYDCRSTRDTLEEKTRRVRRRLQKIKQMLDQGQQPDDSVEEATASLMESIHLPVPLGMETDAAGMMQLMDDELGDQSETASSASTWKQFVPTHRTNRGSATPQMPKRSKLARSRHSMIDIELSGIKVDFNKFVRGSPVASRTMLRVKTIRILDNIKTSTWQTFLTSMASDHTPLPQYSRDMLKVEIDDLDADEVRCKAKLTPLRLHVDQDALDFLKKFFTFEKPNKAGSTTDETKDVPRSPTARAKPFVQHAEIYPIRLKLDYKPKRVDYRLLREGKTIEMMNFFNFEGSDITLRHVTLRGISGWPKLFDLLNDLWTPDVKSNQLADVLSGIAPIRSIVNVGNGMADLILLPIEQYQRDGRLGKGLRDGATRFVKSTVLEAARIGARLATGTQVVLEHAEHLLGGTTGEQSTMVVDLPRRPSNRHVADGGRGSNLGDESSEEEPERRQYSRYANQPTDLRHALDEAQAGFSRGLNEAAQTILAVPMEVYDRRGGEGGQRPVVRAVPIAVLKGAAGASEAITKALQGVQRGLGGVDLAEREEKYKRPSGSSSASSGRTPGAPQGSARSGRK